MEPISVKPHRAIRKVAGSPHQLMLPFVNSLQHLQYTEHTHNFHQMEFTELELC